jgi:hypothetical protein
MANHISHILTNTFANDYAINTTKSFPNVFTNADTIFVNTNNITNCFTDNLSYNISVGLSNNLSIDFANNVANIIALIQYSDGSAYNQSNVITNIIEPNIVALIDMYTYRRYSIPRCVCAGRMCGTQNQRPL